MSNTAAEFRWPLRVYIEDTDAGGIVFYVNYLKYMERARTEFMRAHGYAKAAVFGADLMFVVRGLDIKYRAPARLDDELVATARIIEHGSAQLTFEQRILRGADELCAGHVNIACVDRVTVRPKRIPNELVKSLGLAQA